MAEGIYMGGEVLKGIASKEIRKLVAAIQSQQEKFAKQLGKAKLWDLGGDILQAGLSMFGPLGVAGGGIADLLIDQISGTRLMKGTKAGDVGAIKKLETAYTGSGYGKEFGKMKKEARPDLASGLLQEVGEGLKSYVAGEAMGYPLGKGETGGDWFSNLFGGGGGDLPSWAIEEGVSPEAYKKMMGYKYGGQVPKYYGGGSVTGEGGSPTIVDYFSMQGKTLGGSNTESLAEKLGRK